MSFLQYRIEHWREVTGRRIDDLKYLGGRSLLLQGFARLVDEPRILHRDDRLRCEVLQQRDLLVRERPRFLAIYGEHAEQFAILAQWRENRAADTAQPLQGAKHG